MMLLVVVSVVWGGGEVLVEFLRCDDEGKGIPWGRERSLYNERSTIDGRILTAEAGLFWWHSCDAIVEQVSYCWPGTIGSGGSHQPEDEDGDSSEE